MGFSINPLRFQPSGRRRVSGGLVVSLVIATGIAFAFPAASRAEVLKTLSGRVTEIDVENSSLRIDFQHPATGENKELVFAVDAHTGFGGIKALQELKPRDPIAIDYEENSKGQLRARHIERVQLTGPPAGIEKFHSF